MFSGPALRDIPNLSRAGEIPRAGAASNPERQAIVAPELGAAWTYAQLEHRICRALALLRELGLKPGDRFIYLGRNSDNFFILFFAAIRGGFIQVALNWRSAAAELEYFVTDSTPELAFVDPEFRPALEQAWAGRPAAALIDTEAGGKTAGLRAMLDQDGPISTDAASDDTLTCLLLYTSGTTGRPKGAMISHEMMTIARQIEFCADDMGFPPKREDRQLLAVPAFHMGGLTCMLFALARGAETVLTNDPSSRNLLNLCQLYDITITWLVPTMVRSFVELAKSENIALPNFKMMMYGGAPITPDLLLTVRDKFGCGFSNTYGSTEVSSATILPPADHSVERPELLKSVGRPMPGVTIDIRDPEGNSLPPGKPGEAWIQTPTLMTGYWNRPEATSESVIDGWYRTGDGAFQDVEGYLYLTDRIKDMIISGGENIYPVEVENMLRQHAAVQEAAVVGVPDPKWGEAVTAAIEIRPGHSVTEAELARFSRAHLSAYKCPKSFKFVETLPKTTSGKVQRGQVRKDIAAGII